MDYNCLRVSNTTTTTLHATATMAMVVEPAEPAAERMYSADEKPRIMTTNLVGGKTTEYNLSECRVGSGLPKPWLQAVVDKVAAATTYKYAHIHEAVISGRLHFNVFLDKDPRTKRKPGDPEPRRSLHITPASWIPTVQAAAHQTGTPTTLVSMDQLIALILTKSGDSSDAEHLETSLDLSASIAIGDEEQERQPGDFSQVVRGNIWESSHYAMPPEAEMGRTEILCRARWTTNEELAAATVSYTHLTLPTILLV